MIHKVFIHKQFILTMKRDSFDYTHMHKCLLPVCFAPVLIAFLPLTLEIYIILTYSQYYQYVLCADYYTDQHILQVGHNAWATSSMSKIDLYPGFKYPTLQFPCPLPFSYLFLQQLS